MCHRLRCMLSEGETAPDFELVGVPDRLAARVDADADGWTPESELRRFRLSDSTEAGNAVLLSFYMFDFAPVCTEQTCRMRDAEFFQLTDGLDVYGISADGPYSHAAFAEQRDLNYPLLSDTDGSVAEQYDVLHDEFRGMRRVTERALFVVGPDRTVRYAWSDPTGTTDPDLEPAQQVVRSL